MPVVSEVLAERYRIESVLGAGGMATVYRATDLRLNRQVAVKVLVANLAADAHFAERFTSEAEAMAGFNHPNVASVYDVERGEPATGREPFYVMEYCEGGSLADRLQDARRMSPAELIPIVTAIADALAELHRSEIIHRDVKPANILFAGDRPKLADFGVARTDEPRDGPPLTQPGSTVGTAQYLAPELITGAPATGASDVYALGVTIFQALTGEYPQPSTAGGPNPDAGRGKAQSVSSAAPDLGPAFDAAVARALDGDPLARPGATELAAQLAAGLEILGVARLNPAALAGPDPRRGGASGEVGEALTVVAPAPLVQALEPMEPAEPADSPPAAVAPLPAVVRPSVEPRARPARPDRIRWIAPTILGIALTILAVAVLPGLLGGGRSPGASTGPSAASSTAPSASALPPGGDAALAALGQVDAAIEAARGGKDGLTGRDANELAELATSVRSALQRGDLGAAATSTRALSDRVRALTAGLDRPRRDALVAAVSGLSEALPEP